MSRSNVCTHVCHVIRRTSSGMGGGGGGSREYGWRW